MKRIMLTVAYDGTAYHGWQIQPNGETIESVLNRCLSELLKEPITVNGASRTDAGVHALGNLAVFDTKTRIPAQKLAYALNARLPEDIRIQNSVEVDISFHPRYAESRKTYEYKILNRTFPLPNKRFDTYFYHYPLDVDKMQEAAAYLTGEQDFRSFCSAGAQVKSTVRRIDFCRVSRQQDVISIRISGNGFLYNMVRIIAGTLIRIGGGQMEPEQMREIILAKDRSAAGPTAPACGLTLIGYDIL